MSKTIDYSLIRADVLQKTLDGHVTGVALYACKSFGRSTITRLCVRVSGNYFAGSFSDDLQGRHGLYLNELLSGREYRTTSIVIE